MLRARLKRILQEAAGIDAVADFSLDAPPKTEYGDYATNLPLVLAAKDKQDPMSVAAMLAQEISDASLEKVEIAPPGFLNLYLSRDAKQAALEEILVKAKQYGDRATKAEKIQVEFISANPTGPLTLANGRGGFFGDVLSQVLATQGYTVGREYYINDSGNQVRTLGLAVLAAGGLVPDNEAYYRGDHISRWAKSHTELLSSLKEKPEDLGRAVAADFMDQLIKPAIENKMKIHFDRWTSEYIDIYQKGLHTQALEFFKQGGYVYEGEGALWLSTTVFGDDKDRVLVTSDGLPTYLLMDSGHYLETKERGFQAKINLLGADHYGYVPRIQAAAQILGFKNSKVIVMQLVRLVEGGQEMRMSKRKGIYVTIDELIADAGLDAVRYFFLEKNPETHIDFDVELARKQSKENPVYYIQYAHARLASIFRKESMTPADFDVAALATDSEKALIKRLIQFSDALEDTALDCRVSRLVHYAYELARDFHLFYEKNRILDAAGGTKSARVALALAAHPIRMYIVFL
ncbi:MAG: arginine--tRNA ligase, partial [Candidatus Sungbacteria bacterium]|nr:arginine--tRNA ligase [Candidatus Sungbacteria bacterium]